MDHSREVYWRSKLRRIRFGAEPIADQVARHFRVTLALTAVPVAIGLIFLSIFAAFGRIDVGAWVVGVLLAPVVGFAWLEHGLLRARAARYLAESAARKNDEAPSR